LRLGQKSNKGTRLLDGSQIDAVDLDKESAISLPEISKCHGTQINWISNPTSVRY